MSYVDFFHSGKSSNYDVRLRFSRNKIVNTGTANITYYQGSASTSNDVKLSNSIGSIIMNDIEAITIIFDSILKSNEDFTLATWIKEKSISLARVVCWSTDSIQAKPGFYLMDDGASRHPTITDRNTWNRLLVHQTVPSLNVWNHYAVVRSSNQVSIFLNGVKSSSSINGSFLDGMSGLSLRGNTDTPNSGIDGYIEDFIFIRKALWTNNFTPPTTYLPNEP